MSITINKRPSKKPKPNKLQLPKRTFINSVGAQLSLELLGVAALTCLFLGVSNTSATDTYTSTASVTVATSCQMSAVVNPPHTATLAGGIYEADIGKTTITTTCNDANGYAVFAIGFTNTEFGRNDMLGATTGRTIATGTATSGDTSNWAMKLTAVDGTYKPTIESDDSGSFASYHAVPDDYTKVADYPSNTDDVTGSKLETTYATYVNSVQATDTYTGKVKYTLIHPSDSADAPCSGNYTINYNANSGSGNMDSQTACADRQIALLPNGFTPPTPTTDYQFSAWNTAADGSGHTYYAGQSVANLAEIGSSITLYAQWAPKYIQDLTPTMCSIVASDQPFTVYDRRDGNDYTVRFIKGACWMTQNLRITGTVNSTNSNFSTHENVNVCEGDLTAGNSYNEARCHDSGNTENGVWYNYAAASAKTILTSGNTTLDTENICPANWTLPSYDTSYPAGSVNSLAGAVAAFSPVTGGYYDGGSARTTGDGYWWSTKAFNNSNRYILYYPGSLSTYDRGDRYYGYYIRCMRVSL